MRRLDYFEYAMVILAHKETTPIMRPMPKWDHQFKYDYYLDYRNQD